MHKWSRMHISNRQQKGAGKKTAGAKASQKGQGKGSGKTGESVKPGQAAVVARSLNLIETVYGRGASRLTTETVYGRDPQCSSKSSTDEVVKSENTNTEGQAQSLAHHQDRLRTRAQCSLKPSTGAEPPGSLPKPSTDAGPRYSSKTSTDE